MEEQKKSNLGQVLGIIGLVLGIVVLIISFIPCLGAIAIYPGVIAVVISVIALVQENKNNGNKGLVIAALVISILGTVIAGWQLYLLKYTANNIDKISTELKEAIENNYNVDLDNAVEKLEETGEEFQENMEKTAEDLEKDMEKAANDLEETLDEVEKEKN